MLLDLVHGEWCWEAVGQALTKAGITYRIGKPWTADWLRADFARAEPPRVCRRLQLPSRMEP